MFFFIPSLNPRLTCFITTASSVVELFHIPLLFFRLPNKGLNAYYIFVSWLFMYECLIVSHFDFNNNKDLFIIFLHYKITYNSTFLAFHHTLAPANHFPSLSLYQSSCLALL